MLLGSRPKEVQTEAVNIKRSKNMLVHLPARDKMQISRFRILPLFVISLLITRPVFAASLVESEFELLLPRQFQQNLIDQYWESLQKEEFKFSWNIPDQSYEAPDVNVDLAGLRLDISSRLEKPAIAPGGDTVILQSRELMANFHLNSISIDQYIEREIGGVIGRFRIQAKCEDVNVSLKPGQGVFRMSLTPVFSGSLVSARVNSVDLSWTPDGWSVGELKCTGAQGFDDIIRSEIQKLVGDPSLVEKYKGTLLEYVQNYVQGRSIDIATTRTLTAIRPDIQTTLRITGLVGATVNTILRGTVRVEFSKTEEQDRVFLKLSDLDFAATVSTGAVLRLPDEFLPSIAKEAFRAGTFIGRFSSKQLPGFETLMRSRIAQLLVWPELTKFSKSAEFLFDVRTTKDLSLKGKDLKYKVQTKLHAQMYAPKKGRYVRFMDFAIPLRSEVQLSVSDGKMSAKFGKVKLDLIHSWEDCYENKYCPYRRFAREKIGDRIEDSLEGARPSFALPPIPVTDTLSLRVQRVESSPEKNDLYIYLK